MDTASPRTSTANPPTAARLAAMVLLLVAGVGPSCGRLHGIDAKKGCAMTADCNPGHVCVGGVCAVPVDGGSPDLSPDARGPDLLSDAAGEAGPAPADPCDRPDSPGPRPSPAELAAALVGNWRLCPPAGSVGSFGFLVGPSSKVQLTPTSWSPVTASESGAWVPAPGIASGIYYFVLEAPIDVLHVANGITGVNVAVTLSAGRDVLTLTECNGISRCAGPSTRLVAMQPAGAPTSDAGQGGRDVSP